MSGFFAILDDIATLMDDVSIMTKVAAKKTAGVLGDDLAIGAEKGSSFRASRELPVLWVITKGSFINKLIILPFAFLMTAYAPFLIVPILLIGGVYLSYEGVEKIMHTFFIKDHNKHVAAEEVTDEAELLKIEKQKIKSTILTDFILSVEIIMIALGTVTGEELIIQIIVVTIIAMLATIGVYGLVAFLVRLDDMGFKLIKSARGKSKAVKSFFVGSGKFLVWLLPKLIQLLAIIGTLAMLLVGGGMYVHNLDWVHDLFHAVPMLLSELIVGLIVGLIAFFVITGIKKLRNKK
jgi:predicted DNA repair protein MutK